MGFVILKKNNGLIEKDGEGIFRFHGRVSERITLENSISSYPVEEGSATEHVQRQNPVIEMVGIISNSHIGLDPEETEDQLVKEFETLEFIWKSGMRFDLITRLKVFENVIIATVAFTKDKPTNSMTIDITFKPLLIASTFQVLIPSDILAKKTRRGKQACGVGDWPGAAKDKRDMEKSIDNGFAPVTALLGLKGAKKEDTLKNFTDATSSVLEQLSVDVAGK